MYTPLRGLAVVLAVALVVGAAGPARASQDPSTFLPSSDYVGITLEEAGARATEEGRAWRIVRLDGVRQELAPGYDEHRLNFTVEVDVVTAAATDAERAERASVRFVGLHPDEAAARAEEQGRAWRVVRLDGEDQPVTLDYQPDRVNFTVNFDIVLDAATDEERTSTSVGLYLDEAAARAEQAGRAWRAVRLDGEEQLSIPECEPDCLNFVVNWGVVLAAASDAAWVATSYVGLHADEAAARAEQAGRAWRVVRLDGEDQPVSPDYQPERLNFTVNDDVVIAAPTDAERAG